MLIKLTREAGQDALADAFDHANAQEGEHLAHVRRWYSELSLAQARLGGTDDP